MRSFPGRAGVRVLMSVVALSIGLVACAALRVAWAESEPSANANAADAALRSDVDRLKAQVDALRGEMRVLRESLLSRLMQLAPQPTAPRPVKVGPGDIPALGSSDAQVVLIEFSDYQCPYCRRFYESTLPALKSDYIDKGVLRYVVRDFPLDQLHPSARIAAEIARCAGDQGKYWAMHDVLFSKPEALQQRMQLMTYAEQMQLDVEAFGGCVDSGKHQASVQRDVDDGVAAGVRGTPAFVLGKLRPDNTVESTLLTGARPLADFVREIERVLKER